MMEFIKLTKDFFKEKGVLILEHINFIKYE